MLYKQLVKGLAATLAITTSGTALAALFCLLQNPNWYQGAWYSPGHLEMFFYTGFLIAVAWVSGTTAKEVFARFVASLKATRPLTITEAQARKVSPYAKLISGSRRTYNTLNEYEKDRLITVFGFQETKDIGSTKRGNYPLHRALAYHLYKKFKDTDETVYHEVSLRILNGILNHPDIIYPNPIQDEQETNHSLPD